MLNIVKIKIFFFIFKLFFYNDTAFSNISIFFQTYAIVGNLNQLMHFLAHKRMLL